ncbi:hypothetical protein GCM10023170_011700 [Phytohabitans houttuyneae]
MTPKSLTDTRCSVTSSVTPTTDAVVHAVKALARAVDVAQVSVVQGRDCDRVKVSTLDLAPVTARSISDRLLAGMTAVEVRPWQAGGSQFEDVSGLLLTMHVTVTRFVGPAAAVVEPLAETQAAVARVAALAMAGGAR